MVYEKDTLSQSSSLTPSTNGLLRLSSSCEGGKFSGSGRGTPAWTGESWAGLAG